MQEGYFLFTFALMCLGRVFSPYFYITTRCTHAHRHIYLSLYIYKYRLVLSSHSKAVCVVGAVRGRNSATENSCCILVPPRAPWRNNMLLISRQQLIIFSYAFLGCQRAHGRDEAESQHHVSLLSSERGNGVLCSLVVPVTEAAVAYTGE